MTASVLATLQQVLPQHPSPSEMIVVSQTRLWRGVPREFAETPYRLGCRGWLAGACFLSFTLFAYGLVLAAVLRLL